MPEFVALSNKKIDAERPQTDIIVSIRKA